MRPLAEEVAELEKQRITEALAATEGIQLRAAALLRIPLRTLFNKVRRYDLQHLIRKRTPGPKPKGGGGAA